MVKTICAFRFDGHIGADGQAWGDANKLTVAMAVSLGRLPDREELLALARNMGEIAKHITETAARMPEASHV